MKTNLLVCVPAYGGSTKNPCVGSLISLTHRLARDSIGAEFAIEDIHGVDMVRNYYATRMVRETQWTHLLFIDNDMSFRPEVVLRLLREAKPVIGSIYTKKTDDTKFCVTLLPGRTEIDKSGLCKVAHIGMGLTLIERQAVVKVCEAPTTRRYINKHPFTGRMDGPLYGAFEEDVGGEFSSEDFAFCHRWRALGGDVWAIANETIGHIGNKEYRKNYLEALRAEAAPT